MVADMVADMVVVAVAAADADAAGGGKYKLLIE